MAELTAQERLQPSLLDRLVDNAPAEQTEGDDKKVLTKQALRQAVLRDLAWLFNATAHSPQLDDKRYPNAAKSVLNFGLPPLSGQFASSIEQGTMEQAFRQAILDFEPRIVARTLEVELVMDAGSCGIDMTTVIDLTTDVPALIRQGKGSLEPFGIGHG